MQAVIIEMRINETTIPRTLDEYHERVKSNNQWYYDHDAIAFRMWYNMQTWFGDKVAADDLRKAIDFCLRQEKDAQETGVPEGLRS
jgi:hypothetical protein